MKIDKHLIRSTACALGALLLNQSFSAFGGSVTVLVGSGGDVFSPSTASIPVNTSVIWSWSGNDHSTTSGSSSGGVGTPNGLWNSGISGSGHLFTNTFTATGSFPYYCTVHVSFGMVGTIIVTNAAVPPTVAITNPVSGAVLSAPASLTLKASATDSGGNITKVQFLQGAVSLGNVASAPYSFAVTNLPAATYTFSAIATANSGLTATNSIIVNVINPSPLGISTPAFSTPGQFRFTYSSDIGLTYVVQVSTNLSSGWTPLATNTATVNPTTFIDPNANHAGSFYRVLRLPNP